MPDSVVYESWDCDLPGTFPERSHLYHLRPIGVGTAGVESLTGYIGRLAEAHNVRTGVLLTRELLPRLHQQADDKILAPNYAFIYDAYILNGISKCPGSWVRVLEILTGQTALHVLTMLSWAQIISDLHLLRR